MQYHTPFGTVLLSKTDFDVGKINDYRIYKQTYRGLIGMSVWS